MLRASQCFSWRTAFALLICGLGLVAAPQSEQGAEADKNARQAGKKSAEMRSSRGTRTGKQHILFVENFEEGKSPFGLEGKWRKWQESNHGSLQAWGGIGKLRCWRTVFKPGPTETCFGNSGRAENADRTIVRHNTRTVEPRTGSRFHHAGTSSRPHPMNLKSGVWYTFQVYLRAGRGDGLLKLWINNGRENKPEYEWKNTTVASTSWGCGMTGRGGGWCWGYRHHAVAADQHFYFDGIVVAKAFIHPGAAD